MAPALVHSLTRLSAADCRLLADSVWLLARARLLLWVLPFQRARRIATSTRRPVRQSETRDRIRWAISVGRRFVPAASCLPQALAAEALLMRNGFPVTLRIGVLKATRNRLSAHAWVESEGRLIVGDITQGLSSFTPLPPLPPVAPRIEP